MRIQGRSIDTQVVAAILLHPARLRRGPNLQLLALDLHLSHLAGPGEGKAPHATLAAEVPMDPLVEAGVVAQAPRRGVERGEQEEVSRPVGEPDVEVRHLVAGAAVAFAEAHRVLVRRRLGRHHGGRQGHVRDILGMPTMAGAPIGTAHARGGFGG
ncbi:hypothetical protein BP6252_08067 [Coleophoma cylindrospora]|uniref:Uncharacterized protein n=1 Tax=Coleophoma cylindrospora TaxID=1849047 RepID=A0A3D8RCA3_9HELO|nr:hypothetical protein BP6252_08067 [Coleophoma cylindrospora]